MVNTLVLSVFERTREIGMLRAVGMSRRQLRRMIRHESIITALIGAASGPTRCAPGRHPDPRAREPRHVLPRTRRALVLFAAIAVIAGVLAAVLPARRASRLNLLEALQYE